MSVGAMAAPTALLAQDSVADNIREICLDPENIADNQRFWDFVTNDDRTEVDIAYLESCGSSPVTAQFAEHYALPISGPQDPALLSARDADPVAFFDFLSARCKAAGYRSINCKIFFDQISLDDLSRLLERPHLAVVLLTRSRIGRHISTVKSAITQQFVQLYTTDLRPYLQLKPFLEECVEIDHVPAWRRCGSAP